MARPSVYDKVAGQLRESISTQQDGWEIPSSRSLARMYGVSRNTVRRALEILAEQGTIRRPEGNGRYTRRRVTNAPPFRSPYPAVAVLWPEWMSIVGDDYTPTLLRSFVDALAAKIHVIAGRRTEWTTVQPITGGVQIGPHGSRAGSVVFVGGGSDAMLGGLLTGDAVVMSLDSISDVEGVDSVGVDCEHEAEMAVEHLAGLGHEHVAYVAIRSTASPDHWSGRLDPDSERFSQAMLVAKRRLGLSDAPTYHVVYSQGMGDSSERAVIDRLMRLDPKPTTIVCFSTWTSDRIVPILGQRGLQCPRDISVVTRHMASPGAAFARIQSDPHQIGISAAEHLLGRLAQRGTIATQVLARSRFVEGPTLGPAPGSREPDIS